MKRRRNILSLVKGFRIQRRNKERAAKDAIWHAGNNAFTSRRDKKGDFRRLWSIRINAAARAHGMSYSVLIGSLKKKGIVMDRKILSEIAQNDPEAFGRLIENVRS